MLSVIMLSDVMMSVVAPAMTTLLVDFETGNRDRILKTFFIFVTTLPNKLERLFLAGLV